VHTRWLQRLIILSLGGFANSTLSLSVSCCHFRETCLFRIADVGPLLYSFNTGRCDRIVHTRRSARSGVTCIFPVRYPSYRPATYTDMF
jgi:hypothetical protein